MLRVVDGENNVGLDVDVRGREGVDRRRLYKP